MRVQEPKSVQNTPCYIQIGDTAEVITGPDAPDWCGDWHNVKMLVTGVSWSFKRDRYEVTVQEIHDGVVTGGLTDEIPADNLRVIKTGPSSLTPSSHWYAKGDPDPHGHRFNCERAQLEMGHLTDDEFANAFYLVNHRTDLDSVIWLDAAKCRIRWLSRALEVAIKTARLFTQAHLTFQSRVQPWMMACFGAEITADKIERNHRFLEEALELVQSNGCTQSEAHQLVDYVYGRPIGEINQEAGGVMVTLAALCIASGINMHEAGETELNRIWTKVEQIRAKQAAKPKHSPLPGPTTPQPDTGAEIEKAAQRIWEYDCRHGFGYEGWSWPEHDGDDGYRGDGSYVKIIPRDEAERYRDRAKAALTARKGVAQVVDVEAILADVRLNVPTVPGLGLGLENVIHYLNKEGYLAAAGHLKAQTWQPIETAPLNTPILVYWPQVKLDDDGDATGELNGYGQQFVSEYYGSDWLEPDQISSHGSHLDDDWEWALSPTKWQPLPPAPATDDREA